MESPTKKLKTKARICWLIVGALNTIPMLVFIVIGLINGKTVQKVQLVASVIVAIMLLIVNLATKLRLRSIFWILLCGIGACINDLSHLFITMTVSIMLDEFVFTPLAKHYESRFKINKEIDLRS